MLWIDPADGTRMILASDQGAIVSIDGAHTWSSWYNQPTAQIYHVATETQFPFWVYGAQQDSGAISVPSRSFHRAITQADVVPLQVGGESDNIAPDPLHPGVLGSRVAREDLGTRTLQDVAARHVLGCSTPRPDPEIDAALAQIQTAEQSAPHAPTSTERQAFARQQTALQSACPTQP